MKFSTKDEEGNRKKAGTDKDLMKDDWSNVEVLINHVTNKGNQADDEDGKEDIA
jgi:hypothetical protein